MVYRTVRQDVRAKVCGSRLVRATSLELGLEPLCALARPAPSSDRGPPHPPAGGGVSVPQSRAQAPGSWGGLQAPPSTLPLLRTRRVRQRRVLARDHRAGLARTRCARERLCREDGGVGCYGLVAAPTMQEQGSSPLPSHTPVLVCPDERGAPESWRCRAGGRLRGEPGRARTS